MWSARLPDSAECRRHIQTEGDHRLAHLIRLGGFVEGLATTSDLERRLLGYRQRPRQPGNLFFLLSVPSPTTAVIESRAWTVKQKGMSQFVGEITCPAAEAMGVVVEDYPPRTVEEYRSWWDFWWGRPQHALYTHPPPSNEKTSRSPSRTTRGLAEDPRLSPYL
jgi:hypothetical protein